MIIELSFTDEIDGIFHTYEICTGEQYGKVFEPLSTNWYIYVYNMEHVPNLVCPCTISKCRYQGIVFNTLSNKDQLAMLKRKLEEDFAIERLE